MNRATVALAVCVLVSSIGSTVRGQQTAFVSVQASDWVVHEPTGRVFASVKEEGQVIEFNQQGEVRRFSVGSEPTEMVIKLDRLLVACTKSPSIHVIDLTTNVVTGDIRVSGRGPYALFCSQVDDDYAFCICNTGSAWWDGEVFQVNVKSHTLRKQTKIQRWGQSHALHVAMSRDGKWIVPDARGASSPSGADLMKVDADELTFTQVRDYHSSFGQMVAGPMNRYWTFGNSLYSLDITKKIRTFKGSPVAIHPQFDLAASMSDTTVSFEKFSDGSSIDTVKLTSPTAPKDPRGRSSARSRSEVGFDPTIQFDLKNQNVFIGRSTSGHWVDLKRLLEQSDPLRMINAPSEIKSLVGKTLRVPISLTNEQATPRANLVIESGPESASIQDGKLVWTPKTGEVGFQTFKLVAKIAGTGKVIDSAELTAHVTLPKIELGFLAKTMSLSPNGKHLAVWGPTSGQENRHPAQIGSDDLAIVDTVGMKVVAKKTLPQGVRDAVIDDKYLMLAPNSGNLFYRFDHKLQESKRQFLRSTPTHLLKISPSDLAAVGGQTEVFHVENMTTVRVSDPAKSGRNPNVVQRIGGNVVRVNDRIVDSSSGKLLRIAPGTMLPQAGVQNPTHRYPSGQNPITAKSWGRRFNGVNLTNYKGSRIANISGGQMGVISDKWPIAIVVRTVQEQQTINKNLIICDLVEGTVAHSSVIDVAQARSGMPNFHGARNQLIARGDRIFVLNGDNLLVASIPQTIAKKMPKPTHFSEAQQTEIPVGKTERFLLGVNGDRTVPTYTLMSEFAGVEADERSGEIAVDTQAIWEQFVSTAFNSQQVRNRGQVLDIDENARQYKLLFGRDLPADRFATRLAISAILRDEEGQEDGIDFSLVMTGPRADIDEALIKQKKRIDEQREQQLARQEEMRKQKAMQDEAQVGSKANVAKRLDELETRMRRIEAALDSILKRMDQD